MALRFERDGGVGTRASLGLVVLQSDETIEAEFSRLVPYDGIARHHTRVVMPPEVTSETLATMEAEIPRAAALLPDIQYDVIGYGCTSGATVIGSDNVAAAVHKAHPEAKVTDPVAAVLAACRALGVEKLGFVTPYVAEVSAAMRTLLEDNGPRIAGFGSFEQGDDRIVARITPASVMQAIETVDAMADCDAVFVSCTSLRVAGIAAEAEARIGKPVISSNLALAWHMLMLAGITPDAPGHGRLFEAGLASG